MSAIVMRHGEVADAPRERAVGWWLLTCCALLLALVMLGGATRLTESGLSIVDWRPVTGAVPPLSDAAWSAEFARYQDSPQYARVNAGMTIGEFKLIFWFEYFHRLLARALGLAFALPLCWFWVRGSIPARLRWPLFGVLVLYAAQGYMGWFMVKSGLVDIPRVSPYRLAAHLSLALTIHASMLWIALGVLWPRARSTVARRGIVDTLLATIAATIVAGAFVAGLRAGLMFNTFPLMAGQWVPDGLLALEPAWRNAFENPLAVQFVHRCLALSTLALSLGLWWRLRGTALARGQRLALNALAAMATIQVGLGLATLLLRVPVALGTLHQGGAVLLLSAAIALRNRLAPA